MSELCPLRGGIRPHLPGHRMQCLYCGHFVQRVESSLDEKAPDLVAGYKSFRRSMLWILLAAIVATTLLLASGCTYGNVYARHVSHPLVGRPFESAYDGNGQPVEGSINEVGFSLGQCYGAICIEQSLGYDLAAGCEACMRGGPLLYTGTVTFRLFDRGGAQ